MTIKTILIWALTVLTLTACGGGSSGGSDSGDEVTLNSINLNGLPSSLKVSETAQLTAIAHFSDNSSLDVSALANWSSADNTIATVSSSGLVTAVSAGDVLISASSDNVSQSIQVSIIELSNIAVTSSVSTPLKIAETTQLSAIATFSDTSSLDISSTANWSSADNTIATVSSSGLVTAVSAGDVLISASSDNVSQSIQVSIIELSNIAVSSSVSTPLKIAETTQLSAIATFSDTSSLDISSTANWSSADNTIATVSSSGLVTAVSAGDVLISVSSDNVNQSIQVSVIELSSLSVSPSIQTIAKSSQQQFVATGLNSDNSTENLTSQVSWSVSDSNLASIDNAGLLTSLDSGSVVVTAVIGGLTSTANITVSPAVLNSISLQVPSVMANPSTHQLSATGIYSDGSSQDITQQVAWNINNNNIATINSTGLVSTLSEGSATVIASLDALSKAVSFSVSGATLTTIEVSPKIVTLPAGNEVSLDLTAIYSDLTTTNVISEVVWNSSDEAVATVGANGVIAHAVGSATLTASYLGATTHVQVTVSSAELISISVLPINASVPTGLTQQFTAMGHYSDGSVSNVTEQVTWLSGDDTFVTLNNSAELKGLAQALAQGSATVTAVKNTISQSTQLTTTSAVIQSIEVQPINQSVAKGSNMAIKAIGHFSDGSSVDISNIVQWSATSNTVVDMAQASNGIVKALEQGSSLINATLNTITGLGQIIVSSATLDSISISSALNNLPKGSKQKLTATGVYSDATTQDLSAQVTWQSSDSNIVGLDYSVGNEGVISANDIGSATITASLLNSNANLISASSIMTVNDASLVSLAISAPESSININTELAISAIATYTDASLKDVTQEVNWLSSDNALASVDSLSSSAGLVKAFLQGNVTITASLNNIVSNELAIAITQDDNAPSDIELTVQSNVILNDDSDSATLQATLIPASSSGTIADGTAVTFTIFEGNSESTKSTTTIDGLATVAHTSTFEGLILIVASIDGTDIKTTGALLSTNSFANAIAKTADVTGSFDELTLTLAKDSTLKLFIRNVSNRSFVINQVNISYGTAILQTHFPESPTSLPALTSNNDLTAGEYTGLGYLLDEDTVGPIFAIVYNLTDSKTAVNFNVGITFNFTP